MTTPNAASSATRGKMNGSASGSRDRMTKWVATQRARK
jgi:hypothetical protein